MRVGLITTTSAAPAAARTASGPSIDSSAASGVATRARRRRISDRVATGCSMYSRPSAAVFARKLRGLLDVPAGVDVDANRNGGTDRVARGAQGRESGGGVARVDLDLETRVTGGGGRRGGARRGGGR